MEVIRLHELEKVVTPKGLQVRHVMRQKEVAVVNILLQPGEEVPMHSTPVDVFFYIHEGSGTVHIGDEQAVVSQGEIVLSPADIPHGLAASEGVEFSVLVVKTPNPQGM